MLRSIELYGREDIPRVRELLSEAPAPAQVRSQRQACRRCIDVLRSVVIARARSARGNPVVVTTGSPRGFAARDDCRIAEALPA